VTDLKALKELHKSIAMHEELREPPLGIDEYFCITTYEVRFFNACREAVPDLIQRLQAAEEERDRLAKFKAWVHDYLDRHGVPHHPPGTHGAEGCRIGDRMDWLMERQTGFVKSLEKIADLPHSNPTGDTLHGPCPKCIAELALSPPTKSEEKR
jgi:hypothetical protein